MTTDCTRTFRGISVRLAVRYLTNLGGEFLGDDPESPSEPATVEGDGWRATLTSEVGSVGPSLQLTEVTVAFEGDASVLDELVPKFSQKAMRAGG